MKIPILNKDGGAAGEFELSDEFVIKGARGTQAVRDVVVALQANRRSGTACTKTMGEVAGSGKKPWKQKGTGRARAGSFASPIWRGGGVVFGPKPRDWSLRTTKKVRQLALQKALSERFLAGDVIVVDSLTVSAAKTKEFIGIAKKLKVDGRTALFVVDKADQNLRLASRNADRMQLTDASTVNVYDVLRFHKIVFTKPALEQVEKRLARS
jgi:large subunit ribosomal protein L4